MIKKKQEQVCQLKDHVNLDSELKFSQSPEFVEFHASDFAYKHVFWYYFSPGELQGVWKVLREQNVHIKSKITLCRKRLGNSIFWHWNPHFRDFVKIIRFCPPNLFPTFFPWCLYFYLLKYLKLYKQYVKKSWPKFCKLGNIYFFVLTKSQKNEDSRAKKPFYRREQKSMR